MGGENSPNDIKRQILKMLVINGIELIVLHELRFAQV